MPYFQRKPIERLEEPLGAGAPIPGLPSRGPVAGPGIAAGAQPIIPEAKAASIVQLADATLASEQPLAEYGNEQIKPLSTITGAGPSSEGAISPPACTPVLEPPRDAADLIVEPAPVLSPEVPVAPGETAEAVVSLFNEDEQPAQIEFFSTGLIGQDGKLIQASRIAFHPRELILEAGNSGEVKVQIVVPAQTRGGIYSGLIRASKLDYLHAVLVVQVNEP